LNITHLNHPFRDCIELIGRVEFPNLEFEYTKIIFGCVQNDSSKKVYVKMTNTSNLDVLYDWSFLEFTEDDNDDEVYEKDQIFDIMPINGVLRPGQAEYIEFTFNAIR